METIKGYDYDSPSLEQSPVTMEQLDLLKKTLLWTPEDDAYLKMAGEVLQDQTGDILDLWYGYVGSHSHLLHYFAKEEQPDMNYLAAVRARFEKWVLDICNRPYDQTWLNYQHEIAKRHHSTKKNVTDGANAVPIIHYRYLVAFIYPITSTIRNFLTNKNKPQEDIDCMMNAWFKAITLTVILWTEPYIREGEF
ncbi:protoglobin domain-containing protein [Algoriphagus terrigena]|uniref:protoglobin domain-containing protein n=1 Tax=Algoriphagus terrigena TaxID=344884 RepID=UPI000429BF7E|nr:protoglobin domain-containing protein [Algoriphagus terrigena]